MRKRWRFAGLRFLAFSLAAIVIVSEITMELWNRLMPAIFGLPSISVWQALGLLVLGRLLFGGFGPGGRGWHRRPRFAKGWGSLTPEERERFREAMTPEQRERFREGMRHGCGGGAAPEAAPGT